MGFAARGWRSGVLNSTLFASSGGDGADFGCIGTWWPEIGADSRALKQPAFYQMLSINKL